jgi:phosphoribosylformimino-5-aminoimidazole carboxamide ribotide isomerase
MRIIIAIDIMGGKCVRLTKGDFASKKIYSEDPLEIARQIEDSGIGYLHLVDLDGARDKSTVNMNVLKKITSKTSLSVDYGGGLRTIEDMKRVFGSGASQATAGSIAVKEPDVFLSMMSEFGNERIILGADFKERMVSASGWLEDSDRDVVNFIRDFVLKGAKFTICTDIGRDGMLQGPSEDIYREILSEVKVNLIASGGISSVDDIIKMKETGCEGTIVGKAFYEGRVTLKELSELC